MSSVGGGAGDRIEGPQALQRSSSSISWSLADIGKGIIPTHGGPPGGDVDPEYATLNDREGPVCTGNLLSDFAEHC